jgi:hypothetical protein
VSPYITTIPSLPVDQTLNLGTELQR